MIKSIIDNGYDTNNLEVILMNDGSKDNTFQILKEYAIKYPFIKAYDHEHVGLCRIRTAAIKHVTSEYFIYVDADDYFEVNGISQLMYKINNGETPDLIISKNYKHRPGGHNWHFFTTCKTYRKKSDFRSYIKYHWFFAWNTVYSKKFYESINYEAIPITFGEDLFLMANLLINKPKILFTNKYTYHYLTNASSSIHDAEKQISHCDDFYLYFKNIVEILKKKSHLDVKDLNLLTNEILFVYFLTLIWFYKHPKKTENIDYIKKIIEDSISIIELNQIDISPPKCWWRKFVYYLYLKPRLNKFL